MKGDRLGEFEELTLLAIRAIDPPVYAVPVQRFIADATGRDVVMGARRNPVRDVRRGHRTARR